LPLSRRFAAATPLRYFAPPELDFSSPRLYAGHFAGAVTDYAIIPAGRAHDGHFEACR